MLAPRTKDRLSTLKSQPRLLRRCFPEREVARNNHHGNALARNRCLDGDLKRPRHLAWLRHQFAIMTAIQEQSLRMGFLKITAPDLIARYMRGNGQNRNAATMTVIQAIYQVQITWATTAGAHR